MVGCGVHAETGWLQELPITQFKLTGCRHVGDVKYASVHGAIFGGYSVARPSGKKRPALALTLPIFQGRRTAGDGAIIPASIPLNEARIQRHAD